MILGSVNRPGPVPAFLRSPSVIPPPLDMKPFLQFPLEPSHPASIGLFHNFNTMDPVQKAVMTHTFGPPLVKTKRPIISCNVCQIRFNSESQAEAHYKGNRHARRIKGIETSKTTRSQDGDKQPPPPPASPSIAGLLSSSPKPDGTDKQVDTPVLKESPLTSSSLPTPAQSAADVECPLLPAVGSLLPPPLSPSAALSVPSADPAPVVLLDTPSPAPSPYSGEPEEEKAKKLLYCSLCKVAVNSLSQLEAHNKGTKHKTILEARSGLGPIKAYPRLGPKPSPEQGGDLSSDPNTQEQTFHCEICNVRVNSELQLKQHISSRRHRDGVAGKPNPLLSRHKKRTDLMELPKALGAGLLPNPLALAAAMAAASSNQLALRHPGPTSHPHHPLLQGTPISLLRPAPAPSYIISSCEEDFSIGDDTSRGLHLQEESDSEHKKKHFQRSSGRQADPKVDRMELNQTNQTEDFSCYSPSVTGYRYFAVLWGCAVTITGTAGNLLTILAFALDSRVRTRFNVLIVNLAVADLLYCTILQPISVDSYLHLRWRTGQNWCRVFGLLLFLSNSVSILTLCLVAVSRYLLVTNRALFNRVFSNPGLVALLVSAWALGLASFAPLWPVFVFVPQVCTCSFHRTLGRPYSTILLFFYFFAGLGCVGAFYLLIYRRVRIASRALLQYRLSRRSSKSKPAEAPPTTDDSGVESDAPKTCSSEISSQVDPPPKTPELLNEKSSLPPARNPDTALNSSAARPAETAAAPRAVPAAPAAADDGEFKRVTRMCFTVFLCFVCCFVPFIILNIADKNNRAPQLLHMICANLTWLNSCINPVLYALMNRQFRQAYQVLLSRVATPLTCFWAC
uniref:G-protein coupled receptors family 1 profile domain-containing protein n=2 Tax=Oryzias latipes TaxID=8090 RepID=A0A3B3IBF1_ORYLA